MMFLEWLNASQTNYDALMYGIEGKTYVLTDFEGRKMADVLPGTDPAKSYIMWNGRWGLWRYAYMRGGPADGGKRMMTQGLPAELALPGNVFSPLLSFNFDTTPVKTELAKRVAVWDDYGRQLEFGMIADADKGVDQMIKLCTDAGADVVLKELQKQVDAFMAKK
jgi:putative aldouronate transport system substrate-binding protein